MIVTLADLDTAIDRATDDFVACGLYTAALHRVPVRLTLASTAYGWCLQDGSRIDIPAVSLARLGELFGNEHVTLADVVRHELAHALAFLHPELVRGRRFARVFGAAHDDEWEHPPAFHRAHFVSRYATSAPCEDFAETVMVYTRRRGRVRTFARHEGIHRAFEYVSALATRIRRGRLLHTPARRLDTTGLLVVDAPNQPRTKQTTEDARPRSTEHPRPRSAQRAATAARAPRLIPSIPHA